MILLIDNYDSFVHNLARYIGELGVERQVLRNDALSVDDVIAMKPEAIILSPGPCGPEAAGICVPLVRAALRHDIPLLGVCLGHQAITVAFDGTVLRAAKPVHGKPEVIFHQGTDIFAGLPTPFQAGRYHSLIGHLREGGDLLATARTATGEVMALAHRTAQIYGVQFHPESVLTDYGHALLSNFLDRAHVAHRRITAQDRKEPA
ncbi:MAG: aminodeoxychorismate/anthranilate synthase component II [Rhizobiales bacterium]|nr:aminodeoxychorismate/anthranilate synthase component II [Hyphomicrobiales bacterium]